MAQIKLELVFIIIAAAVVALPLPAHTPSSQELYRDVAHILTTNRFGPVMPQAVAAQETAPATVNPAK